MPDTVLPHSNPNALYCLISQLLSINTNFYRTSDVRAVLTEYIFSPYRSYYSLTQGWNYVRITKLQVH